MKGVHYKSATRFVEGLRLGRGRWEYPKEWGFRGQRDASWPLQPSLMRGPKGKEAWRSYCDDHVFDTRAAIFLAETMVMESFITEADQHGLNIPSFYLEDFRLGVQDALRSDFRRPTDVETVSKRLLQLCTESMLANVGLAQHYGCPTRLLDWTSKPLVAAYFAAKDACTAQHGHRQEPKGDLAVFGLNTYLLDSIQSDRSESPVPEIAVVTAPQATNPNLAAQAAFFVLDRLNREEPLEKLIDNLPRNLLRGTMLYKLTLPKSEAPKLLRILADEGISASSVFPGYGGVAEAVFEQSLWDRAGRQMRSRWQLHK